MTATRTSNKQILEAISEQSQAINALVSALTQNAAPQAHVEPPVVTPLGTVAKAEAPERSTEATSINVPKQYLAHMQSKVTTKAAEQGASYMLYARKNLHGETKLAYCKADRWASLKDKGLIGPIELIEA